MVPKFLSATTILHPSAKQTRKARKSHRDQEALLASELQAQSDLAPFVFFDGNDDDDDDKDHSNSAHPIHARKAATACRTQGVKNWVQRLTHRPKRSPTRHSAPPTTPRPPDRNGNGNGKSGSTDNRPPSLLTLPGELQNLTITFLSPVALALLRLTCRHFHTIIPTPTFTTPLVAPPTDPPQTPDPVRLLRLRCHRFAFLTTLHPPPPSTPSPYLPRNWNVHAAVCGAAFYPCTGCKAFHHLEWFAPYGATVRRFPSLRTRPVDCRACVLHTFMPAEEEDGLYSPEVWPGFAERWRGWRVGRWWRCECCGRCVREGSEEVERDVDAWVGRGVGGRTALEWESRSPGKYLMAVQGTARTVVGGGGGCVCGCDVCAMVGIDCWERGGRTVVLYRK